MTTIKEFQKRISNFRKEIKVMRVANYSDDFKRFTIECIEEMIKAYESMIAYRKRTFQKERA